MPQWKTLKTEGMLQWWATLIFKRSAAIPLRGPVSSWVGLVPPLAIAAQQVNPNLVMRWTIRTWIFQNTSATKPTDSQMKSELLQKIATEGLNTAAYVNFKLYILSFSLWGDMLVKPFFFLKTCVSVWCIMSKLTYYNMLIKSRHFLSHRNVCWSFYSIVVLGHSDCRCSRQGFVTCWTKILLSTLSWGVYKAKFHSPRFQK